MSKPVTLQDIANRLGITKVSVSKALRQHADISSATTKKVLETAAEMGYRPNILARKLGAKSTRTIGLVVPKIAHHFLTRAIDAIYTLANEVDYEIVMMVSEENEILEARHIETLLSMRVDGLLISVTEKTTDPQPFIKVNESGTPLVFFDRVLSDLDCSCITSADMAGARELTAHAVNKGYRRFGHLGGYQDVSIGSERYKGFLQALQEADLSVAPQHLSFGGFSRRDGYEGFKRLWGMGALPEIIFAVTYPVALGMMEACKELGGRIPQDVDLICFGGSHYNHLISPPLTGIAQPADEIGKMALSELLRQLNSADERLARKIVVPVELHLGETCQGPWA
jgi:LacI family transcriptional regulator